LKLMTRNLKYAGIETNIIAVIIAEKIKNRHFNVIKALPFKICFQQPERGCHLRISAYDIAVGHWEFRRSHTWNYWKITKPLC